MSGRHCRVCSRPYHGTLFLPVAFIAPGLAIILGLGDSGVNASVYKPIGMPYNTAMQSSKSHILEKARQAVARSGLTHQQIGQRMGCPPESARQTVSRFLLSPNPSVLMLKRLAKALGVNPGDLL